MAHISVNRALKPSRLSWSIALLATQPTILCSNKQCSTHFCHPGLLLLGVHPWSLRYTLHKINISVYKFCQYTSGLMQHFRSGGEESLFVFLIYLKAQTEAVGHTGRQTLAEKMVWLPHKIGGSKRPATLHTCLVHTAKDSI
jgi:hypothetical protein